MISSRDSCISGISSRYHHYYKVIIIIISLLLMNLTREFNGSFLAVTHSPIQVEVALVFFISI